MRTMVNKYIILFFIAIIAGFLYGGYVISQPVKVIALHKNAHSLHILVDRFPLTSKFRIDWWLENKARLFRNYNISEGSLAKNNIAIGASVKVTKRWRNMIVFVLMICRRQKIVLRKIACCILP